MDFEARKILDKVWAEDAGKNRIENDATEWPEGLDRSQGWGVEYEQNKFPERKVWNQLLREIQGACRDKMLYGIPHFTYDIDYPQYAFVRYANFLYYAKVAISKRQENPSVNSDWEKY